jgi:hypothetical protein
MGLDSVQHRLISYYSSWGWICKNSTSAKWDTSLRSFDYKNSSTCLRLRLCNWIAMSVARFLRRISQQQRLHPNIILHYDSTSRNLHSWFWYVVVAIRHLILWSYMLMYVCDRPASHGNDHTRTLAYRIIRSRERTTPTDLVHLRLTHEFKAPCCLCACQAIGGGYTESAMYIADSGPYVRSFIILFCCDADTFPIFTAARVPAPPPILYLPHTSGKPKFYLIGT